MQQDRLTEVEHWKDVLRENVEHINTALMPHNLMIRVTYTLETIEIEHDRYERKHDNGDNHTGMTCQHCGSANVIQTGYCATCANCGETTSCG